MNLSNQQAFERISRQRSGCITYENTNLSEQMRTTFPNWPYKIARITRAYFQEFLAAKAIVVIEFHSSVVQRLKPVTPAELESTLKTLPKQVKPTASQAKHMAP